MCNRTGIRRRGVCGLMAACTAALLPGCAQFALLGLLVGGPPHIEPEFDRETKQSLVGTDVKVAVVCYAKPELKLKYSKIDAEVAAYVTGLMQMNRIGVVDTDYIRGWIDEHPDWETAAEIGEAFDADYVVEIELTEFGLYEPHSASLFRGTTLAHVDTYQLNESGAAERIFEKDVNLMYPTKVPRPAYDTTELAFKREFLSRIGEEIGFLFYPSYNGDKIAWAN